MGMPRRVTALAVALLAVSSCAREERRSSPGRSKNPAATATTSAKASANASPSETAATPGAPAAGHELAERLASEAASRPSGTVSVEDVVAGLGVAGDPVIAERQVLAGVVGARYCAILETRSGVLLSICEFDSAQAAEAGERVSRDRFDRLVPGRRFERNGSTLLTVTPREGGEADDPSGSVRELFAALSPQRQERNEQ